LRPQSKSFEDGTTNSDFETAFSPLYADDEELRLKEPCLALNIRSWRIEMEADIECWLHAEISNVVLTTWANYPHVLQVSHGKPRTADPIKENVDTTYSVKIGSERHPLAIGEFKRN
jgi:hypothetical protein